jgi:hypothetical protein
MLLAVVLARLALPVPTAAATERAFLLETDGAMRAWRITANITSCRSYCAGLETVH